MQDYYFLLPVGLNRKAYKKDAGESDKWKREPEFLIMDSHSSPNRADESSDYGDGSPAFWIGTAASSQATGPVHG